MCDYVCKILRYYMKTSRDSYSILLLSFLITLYFPNENLENKSAKFVSRDN